MCTDDQRATAVDFSVVVLGFVFVYARADHRTHHPASGAAMMRPAAMNGSTPGIASVPIPANHAVVAPSGSFVFLFVGKITGACCVRQEYGNIGAREPSALTQVNASVQFNNFPAIFMGSSLCWWLLSRVWKGDVVPQRFAMLFDAAHKLPVRAADSRKLHLTRDASKPKMAIPMQSICHPTAIHMDGVKMLQCKKCPHHSLPLPNWLTRKK